MGAQRTAMFAALASRSTRMAGAVLQTIKPQTIQPMVVPGQVRMMAGYKQKTLPSLKKRFKLTGTGHLKRCKAGKRHLAATNTPQLRHSCRVHRSATTGAINHSAARDSALNKLCRWLEAGGEVRVVCVV